MGSNADLDQFRVEVDTHGFRSQFMAVGARAFVRRLVFEAPYITSIVWIACEPRRGDEGGVIDYDAEDAAA